MPLFTPEDLLRYLYKESSPELAAAIDAALKEDWTLREQLQDLQASCSSLDKTLVAPRTQVISRVMQYARETAIEGVHHP